MVTALANAWHADRTEERYSHVVLPVIVGVVAFISGAATTLLPPRYFSVMLTIPGVYTGYVVVLAWISSTVPRPPGRRAAAVAATNVVSNTSSIYSSYLYPQSAEPRYDEQRHNELNEFQQLMLIMLAFAVNCASLFIAICCVTIFSFMWVRLNKELDRGEYFEGAVNAERDVVPGEVAKKGFRFLY